ALRPHHVAAMGIERRDRLVEVGRCRRELDLKLLDPADVVQVHADDLRRHDRRQMLRLGDLDPPPVARHQLIALALDFDRRTRKKDPPRLPHVYPSYSAALGLACQPSAGRSNQTWTCPVPTEFSYSL